VWIKGGARPGDALVLSEPLGSGIVLAGGTPEDKAAAVVVHMCTLNLGAAEALSALGDEPPHAVTALPALDDVLAFRVRLVA